MFQKFLYILDNNPLSQIFLQIFSPSFLIFLPLSFEEKKF